MFRLLGLPRFSGCLGYVTGLAPLRGLAGLVILAMFASLTMHLLRIGWQTKFGVTIIE